MFVCDHPYYAVTDADGRFRFPSVPAGQYELVAWHPNWVVAHTERNPENGRRPGSRYLGRHWKPPAPFRFARAHHLANLTLPK